MQRYTPQTVYHTFTLQTKKKIYALPMKVEPSTSPSVLSFWLFVDEDIKRGFLTTQTLV